MLSTEIRNGTRCQYDNAQTEIRGSKYGYLMTCPLCGSYVSVNEDMIPIGMTANEDLRKARRNIHPIIDKLIIRKMIKGGIHKPEAKAALYKYIQERLNLDFELQSIAQLSSSELMSITPILKII